MSEELAKLFDLAKQHVMSDEERDAQRRSFVYGNIKIENELVTREMVDEAIRIVDGAKVYGAGR